MISGDHKQGAKSSLRATRQMILDQPNWDRNDILKAINTLLSEFDVMIDEQIKRMTQ